MKQFLPLLTIFGLAYACAPPHKINQNEEKLPSAQNEKRIHIEKQIAPGTCSLQIANCTIIEENSKTYLVGNIASIKAYGAGFTSSFEKGQKLTVILTEQQLMHLKDLKTISCLISDVNAIKNESHFKLVEYQQAIEK
ncbi:hypothetical protein [Labilibaculum sp.]|uniref:hypothetical protein n=1 Tax=Labilibaculum sp. TaxID=2060723 RepID=UPI0035672CB3